MNKAVFRCAHNRKQLTNGGFVMKQIIKISIIMLMAITSPACNYLYTELFDQKNIPVILQLGLSQTAKRVYGQSGSFTANMPNNDGVSADSLFWPKGVAVDAGGVYIADYQNNRVLYYSGTSTTASRVYGQSSFSSNAYNNNGLSADSLAAPTGVAVDANGVDIAEYQDNRELYYSGTSTTATRVYGSGGRFGRNNC